MHQQNLFIYLRQLLGKYWQEYRHNRKAHHRVLDKDYFFVNEHCENGVLELTLMVMRFVPLLEEVSGLLLEEVAVDEWRRKLLLECGVAGRGLGMGLGAESCSGFLWLLLLFEPRDFL